MSNIGAFVGHSAGDPRHGQFSDENLSGVYNDLRSGNENLDVVDMVSFAQEYNSQATNASIRIFAPM